MLNKLLMLEPAVFARELESFVGPVVPLIVIVIYTDNYVSLSSSGFAITPNSLIIMDFRKFVVLMDELNQLDEEGHKDASILLSKLSFTYIQGKS
jgi:hypothetical protein